MEESLPYFVRGEVVKGFGRGSRQLGIPTANFPENVVDSLPSEVKSGVYFGWASVDNGPVYKMVMSVGWNPQFQNEKRSMETHLLHEFSDDFYGSELCVCITGYVREEMKFDSLDELIQAIQNDISIANQRLDGVEMKQLVPKFEKYITNKIVT